MTKTTIKMMHGAAFVRNHILEIMAMQNEGYTLAYIFDQYKEKEGLTLQLASFLQAVKQAKKGKVADQAHVKSPTQIVPEEQHQERQAPQNSSVALAKVLGGDESYLKEIDAIADQARFKFNKKV